MRPVLKVVVATSSKNLYPISEHAGLRRATDVI